MSTTASPLPLWVYVSGQLAPVASIVVFLSPYPTIQKILVDRNVGTLPLLPYSSMVSSAYLWFVYGILKHESAIYTSNAVGLALGIYYFLSFQRYAPKSSSTLPGSIQQHTNAIYTVVGITTILPILLSKTTINTTEIIGKIGVLFCIGMFASPLAALQSVLVTKSARSIPLPFTIASLVNCLLWSIFGLYQTNDANVYIPNLLGLSFSLIQVALKLYFSDAAVSKRGFVTDETKILQTDSAV